MKRRLRTDLIRRIKQRPERPVTQYGILLKMIDGAEEMIFPDYDNNWDTCVYLRSLSRRNSLHPPDVRHAESMSRRRTIRRMRPGEGSNGAPRWNLRGMLGGAASATHDMKVERKRRMGCVGGFLFSISGRGALRNWGSIIPLLRESVAKAREDVCDVLDWWALLKLIAVEEKESTYGSSWSAPFSKMLSGRQLPGSLNSVRESARSNAFFRAGRRRYCISRGHTSARSARFRAYALRAAYLCMARTGILRRATLSGSQESCRPYQVSNFALMGEDESEGDANAANARLLKSPPSTWRGNLGALQAEMMGMTQSFAGREVGRFFTPPRQER